MFTRPALAVVLALIGIALSLLLRETAIVLPLTGVAQAVAVTIAATAPLLAAGILIPVIATSAGFGRAVGLSHVRGMDVVIGVCAGLVVRALTEIVAPTVGTVADPFGGGVSATIILSLAVAIAVSPFVEELLFRGVLQRALADSLRAAGTAVATGISIAITTAAFVLVHVTTAQVQVGLLVSTVAVGVVCGLLTAGTGRLSAAITAHTVHNTIGVMLLLT